MVVSIVLAVIGLLSIGYFIGYFLWAGLNDFFLLFWLLLGVLMLAWSGIHYFGSDSHMQKKIEIAVFVLFFTFMAAAGGTLIPMFRCTMEKPAEDADYLLVLGAHVYGETMSQNLQYRVEAALDYAERHPGVSIVLSGGQGMGENISEALAMKRFFLSHGIKEDRLILEDLSTNTDENIQYSLKRIVNGKMAKVIIVSNDFHIYRAMKIAQKQGMSHVSGIGSKTHPYSAPNMYLREVFAVWKYKWKGQI